MQISSERRSATRIDKVFRVMISTEEQGDQWYVARNVSATGMFVEMSEPLPLRTKVIVRFQLGDAEAELCAVGRVQNHYYLHYNDQGAIRGLCGVGLKLVRFLAGETAEVPAHQLH
ncbi:MAG: PilZ domain-containing protein [Myxococcales bacterium FL481]|nr:MAG: PilZ domain-containing protein [Myxococcales bacterium FL481]